MKSIKSILGGLAIIGGLTALSGFIQAQDTTAQDQSTSGNATLPDGQPDSVVRIAADAQGLQLLSPEQIPGCGTFWIITDEQFPPPYPFLPSDLTNAPVFSLGPDGEFLVDATSGAAPQPTGRQAMRGISSSTLLQVEGNMVLDLITKIQGAQLNHEMAVAFGLDEGMDSPSGFSPMLAVPDPTALWLEITNVSNGLAYLNLHNGTNLVYAIESTSALPGGWRVETEVWPTNGTVIPTVTPFTVPTLERPNLFLRAEDWTGVDSDGDGIPDWWGWMYFGTTNVSATTQDYSGDGYTFADDYANLVPPTVFKFTGVEVTNNYVNNMSVPVQLDVAGTPYYIATLVDDGNFSNAVWNTYSSSNVTINLGTTEGWHDVWIGLRGHADAPSLAVWQWKRLKLDFTPPQLTVTGPTNSTVTQPVIQLAGYSPEQLASISYDLSNAVVIATNQQALITDQSYSTNTFEFTTNWFQCFDVAITNGVNTFTVHATDLAGNVTTTNFSFTLDYSGKTNPPVIQSIWPQDGMKVCGSSFIWNGWVSDPTATVTAQMVDTSGATNMFNGAVGRDGKFWVQSLPLNSGTNNFTLTVTDVAGNIAVTNITVIQGNAGLTIDPIPASQTTVTGKINANTFTVWVNGVQATVSSTANGDGVYTWEADNVPIPPNNSLVQVTAIPGNGGGQ